MRTIRKLWRFFRPHLGLVFWATFSMAVLSGLGMIRPYLAKELIDRVILGGEKSLLPRLAGILVAVSALRGVFNYLRQYLGELFGQRSIYDLRVALYAHLQGLPFAYYDKARTGDLMSRLTGDVEAVRNFAAFGFIHLMDFFFMLAYLLPILFALNVPLTLAALGVTPLLGATVVAFDRRIRPAFGRVQQTLSTLTARIQESITGVRVVKAFAREGHETDVFSRRNRDYMDRNLEAAGIWSTFIPVMNLVSGVTAAVVFVYGGWLCIQDRITLGTLVAFNSYVWILMWVTRDLGWLINLLEHALAAGDRLIEILATPAALAAPPGARPVGPLTGHVVFDNVSFDYGDGPGVLKDVTFEARPGSLTALVGPTGSGKTSIVALVPRFYDCTAGRVLVDGKEVREIDLASLRSQIGVALQDTFLFSASVRDNIAYGRPDAGMEEVLAAAETAQVREFAGLLPEGYDTVVGERGVGLSGGQKQRIAVARALLVNPRILILDDSTSSVDMETEYVIQRGLARLMRDRTTFVIAHRLSTVKSADQILVLEGGRIVERGTHRELLSRDGRYRAIHDVQFRDQEEIADLVAAGLEEAQS